MARLVLSCVIGALALAVLGSPAPAFAAREIVDFPGQPAGMIVVRTSERKLYLTLGDGRAIRYPVAVGMRGRQWSGTARIDGKYVEPAWSPPAEVKRAKPSIPNVIPPGPNNPMGLRALTLDRGQYAIHGTTRGMRASIGSAASFGCIRMYNEDVVDLFDRVPVGTQVVVLP
jgi:lipoprotein-anchoring transpeptidase ErfK/SrfK